MARTMITVIFVAIFLFMELASAAPRVGGPPFSIGKSLSKRSFRVDRVQTGKPSPRSAHKAMRKAFNKYGWPMPDAIAQKGGANSAAKAAGNQTGSVQNTPEQFDVEFLSPITVGGQKMMMDFDTGSSDLWLFSTALSAQQQAGHTNFDPTKSATFKQQAGSLWRITFGDNSAAEGNIVGTDTVNIGGATATNQVVELATQVSESFVEDTASNGLVGLAFSQINTVTPNQATTFLDTIKNDLALPGVMTANLKANTTGAYEFGKINKASFTGNLAFMPVDSSQGFWQFESAAFAVGNGAPQANTVSSPAIADTGTTLLLVDDNVAQSYYDAVDGAAFDENQGMFTFPCNAQLQDLHIALGPKYMACIDKSLILFQPLGDGSGMCFGSVQGNQGQGIQILGDVLFKSQFTVFNIVDKTIAFAPHA